MIFNNRKEQCEFKLENQPIEQVDRYCYLGTIMTPSGTFKETWNYINDKATKAYFSIRQSLDMLHGILVQTYLKIFNSVIIPIIIYRSEVWGAYIKCKNISDPIHIFNNNKHVTEKLHNKFCKFLLRVKKSTSVVACLAELGQYPIITNIMNKMLSYYTNIAHNDECTLARKALILLEKDSSSSGKANWASVIKS